MRYKCSRLLESIALGGKVLSNKLLCGTTTRDLQMNEEQLYIAVFGSWRGTKDQEQIKDARELDKIWTNRNTKESFDAACMELGREIAKSGHKLLVASDSPSTVDYHIVQGVIKESVSLDSLDPPIHVVRSRAPRSSKGDADCSAIMSAFIESHPSLFDEPEFFKGTFSDTDRSTSKWEQVHDHVANIADKLLIIGGGAAPTESQTGRLVKESLLFP